MADTAADADEKMARERIGRVLGGAWKLERLIGIGGMAAVYAARGKDDQRAALKVLHPEMSRRTDIRQRFAQEATAATRVGHPGVVAVLGNGDDPDGTAFLVLELLDGESLSDLLNREGTLPLPRLLDVLDEILDVLAAAHERGIVHRDLKPDNLFVTANGRVKVLDFGIARVLDDLPGAYKTRTGITIGTVPFMSPEQALGKRAQVDGRSDLFSLGAMVFRILSGRHVHAAETDAELLVAMASKPAPPLASAAPSCPPAVCAVVDLALAFSKDSRYPDARTMQEDVRAIKAGRAPPYAGRVHSSRQMATRTDLHAPAISVVANRAGATVPEATAPTRPDTAAATARGAIAAAPLEAGAVSPAGIPTPTVPGSPPFTIPDTSPPASLRGADLPKPQTPVVAAPTVQNPVFAAPTIQMVAPPDGRTLTSTPPPASAAWLRPVLIGIVGLSAVLGGGYVVLSKTSAESAGSASAASDPAAVTANGAGVPSPGTPPTAAAATSELGAGTPNAATDRAGPASLVRGGPSKASTGAATTAQPAPTATTPAGTPPAPQPSPQGPQPTSMPTAAPPSPPAPSPTTPSPTAAPPSPSPTPTNQRPTPAPTPTTTQPPAPSPAPTSTKGWEHGHKHH